MVGPLRDLAPVGELLQRRHRVPWVSGGARLSGLPRLCARAAPGRVDRVRVRPARHPGRGRSLEARPRRDALVTMGDGCVSTSLRRRQPRDERDRCPTAYRETIRVSLNREAVRDRLGDTGMRDVRETPFLDLEDEGLEVQITKKQIEAIVAERMTPFPRRCLQDARRGEKGPEGFLPESPRDPPLHASTGACSTQTAPPPSSCSCRRWHRRRWQRDHRA